MKEHLRRWGLLYIVACIFIILSFLSPSFRRFQNVMNILRASSIMGIFALGLTMIMNAGEFDLSFPGIAALSAVTGGLILAKGVNIYLVYLIILVMGVLIGLLNGLLVTKIRIPSFVCTLGTLTVMTGIAGFLTNGAQFYSSAWPKSLALFGRGFVFGFIPVPIIIFAICAAVVLIFMEYTKKGRHIQAVGGNKEAAKHVGINTTRIKLFTFVISGLLSAVSGIITFSQLGMVSAEMNMGHQMPTISVCYLGAVFLKDGIPNVAGSIVGALLLAIITNGLTMLGARFYTKDIVQGLILVIAVGILVLAKKGEMKNLAAGL